MRGEREFGVEDRRGLVVVCVSETPTGSTRLVGQKYSIVLRYYREFDLWGSKPARPKGSRI